MEIAMRDDQQIDRIPGNFFCCYFTADISRMLC
jgi:hypothetical protein